MRALFFMVVLNLVGNCFAGNTSDISRGGLLYDRWYEVVDVKKPDFTHPGWPASNTNKHGSTTHRCKSCHGWDYKGRDGAYRSGSYKTGIPGIQAFSGGDKREVLDILTNELHGMERYLPATDLDDLALFIVDDSYRSAVLGAAIWFAAGVVWFAVIGRKRLVRAPEESFALQEEETES